VWDENRDLAIRKMSQALNEFVIQGVKTTIPLHQRIMEDEDFIKGVYDTSTLQNFAKA